MPVDTCTGRHPEPHFTAFIHVIIICSIAGHKFEDPHFGYMRPRPPKEISEDVRNRIADKIREFL
jgi:hypothetical protein